MVDFLPGEILYGMQKRYEKKMPVECVFGRSLKMENRVFPVI